MSKAHPDTQSFGISTKVVVARQGYDTAPTGPQGSAGHQEGRASRCQNAVKAIQLGHPIIMQGIKRDLLVNK